MALPEATEEVTWGTDINFRVRKKIFAFPGQGGTLTLKADREELPALLAEPGSHLVNVSSLFGLVAPAGQTAYAASKFAIRGMTKVAARELAGFGIRVNSVHPGGVLTRMVVDSEGARSAEEAEAFLKAMPLGRFGESAEISRLVAYLASDDSSYSTGSEFVADGGLLSGPGY